MKAGLLHGIYMGNGDLVDGALQVLGPKSEKAHEFWKVGCGVKLLPNIALDQAGIIGHVVEDLGGGELEFAGFDEGIFHVFVSCNPYTFIMS